MKAEASLSSYGGEASNAEWSDRRFHSGGMRCCRARRWKKAPRTHRSFTHCERHVHDIVVGVRSFDEIGVVSEIVPQSNRPLHIYSVISKTSRGRLELSRATRSSRRRLELSRPTRLSLEPTQVTSSGRDVWRRLRLAAAITRSAQDDSVSVRYETSHVPRHCNFFCEIEHHTAPPPDR